MKFQVITLRSKGRLMNRDAQVSVPRYVGELSVDRQQDHVLSRQVLRARLTDLTSGTETDVLPVLDNAELIWAVADQMRLTGTENLDGTDYAQTWSLERL